MRGSACLRAICAAMLLGVALGLTPLPFDVKTLPTLQSSTRVGAVSSSDPTAYTIPACPAKAGFITVVNQNYVLEAKSATSSGQKVGLAAAEAACRANSKCIVFNNYGYYSDGKIIKMYRHENMCTYIKDTVCPPKAGYTTIYGQNYIALSGSGGQESSVDAAEKKCTATKSCTVFNNFGYWHGGPIKEFITYSTMCQYVKTHLPCPVDKPGYFVQPNLDFVVSTGSDAWSVGKLSVADAEALCTREGRCSVFNNAGVWGSGSVLRYFSADGYCAYTKQPCKPITNFVAVNGYTSSVSSSKRASSADLAGAQALCASTSGCVGFNDLGYIWTSAPQVVNMAKAVKSGGLCFYERILGV